MSVTPISEPPEDKSVQAASGSLSVVPSEPEVDEPRCLACQRPYASVEFCPRCGFSPPPEAG